MSYIGFLKFHQGLIPILIVQRSYIYRFDSICFNRINLKDVVEKGITTFTRPFT